MNNAIIARSIVKECNDSINSALKNPNDIQRAKAEIKLITCGNIAAGCGMIALKILIDLALEQFKAGLPEKVPYNLHPNNYKQLTLVQGERHDH